MARRLAHEGFTVFAGMRSPAPIAELNIKTIALDVTDETSILAAAAEISRLVGVRGLFALVNNAAVLEAGPIETVAAEQIERQLRANVIGPVTVTQAFLPLLRAAKGRIVNIGSINAQLPLPYWGVYSATKAALLALSDALRMELAPWNISVTMMTLGAFATDIRARALDTWIADARGSAYADARDATAALASMLDATASEPALVADALVDILLADHAPDDRAVGKGIDDLLTLALQPAETRQRVIATLLETAAAGVASTG